ncbi:MAG: class I SAM-dependent methyltransferase [Desulfobacteraceae bacterium]|nr:class I SAM-dependent methyltransferase [Desulfobacteraceae bacterium]
MKKDVLQNFMIKHSSYKKDSPVVLIWELGGFPAILIKNAIFSCALNVRGYNTHFLICDGVPEACIQRSLDRNEKLEDWSKQCPGCLARMKDMAAKYCVPYSLPGDYIAEGQKQIFRQLSEQIAINEIINYKYLGVSVGALAWSSVNRYMKGYLVNVNELKEEDEKIYRKYLYAALVNTYIADAAIEKLKPVSILTSHGVYVDYNPPMSLAYLKGLNAVSWSSGFSNHCHYFTTAKGIDKPGLRGITEREWEKRKNRPLTAGENKILDDIIHDRYFDNKALDLEIKSKPEDEITLREKLRINNNNPIVTLFAHVNWDAVFNLGNMLFDNANQWVIESIEKMSEIRDVNWIIRLHPGEKYNGSLFTTGDLIRKEFENIPEHIKIIWNDSEVNSYGLYRLIDVGITIFGTVGAELPLFGKPVVSVGDARFSGKGFTIDAKSKEEYFSILENARDLKPLTDGQKELARRYAYSCFAQSQVPLNIMNKKEGHWGNIDLTRLEELLPGNDPILDKTCEGIIHGKDVILDEEITYGRTDCVSDLKEVYSGDQQGKIIIGDNNVFRIIHKNEEANVRKILDLIGEDLENLQIVDTKIVADKNILKQLNASEDQLVLEHRRISSITYPHEWPPSMLQDAALFQLKLSAALLSKGLYLKDAHPLNILFESGKPVLVDFTSIVTKEALFNERYLKGNSKYNNEPENIRISVLILEIYKRMFLPYFYIPLCAYAFGNKKSVGTIIHETTLNTSKRATALTSAINEYELNSPQVADNLRQVEKIFENFVSDLDANRLFDSLYRLIQELPIASRKSGYTNYYEKKGENQDYTQMEDFNEKQKTVFEALNQESIRTVLDIGANTGWYSLMAEHMGKEVTAVDIDTACVERLYDKVKLGNLNIQPVVADFTKISSQRLSIYDDKPVMLDGFDRLGCDSVLVLALLHHLVLGAGMTFDEIFSKISLLTKKQLVLEYISIDDSLIQNEPDFFPAYYRNPNGFGFYNLDNLLRTLKKFYSDVEVKWSTKDTRMILVCRKRQDKDSNAHQKREAACEQTVSADCHTLVSASSFR